MIVTDVDVKIAAEEEKRVDEENVDESLMPTSLDSLEFEKSNFHI